MTLIGIEGREITAQFTADELLIINNALNEVCNGIDIDEFGTRIGASTVEVRSLLASVGNVIEKSIATRPADLSSAAGSSSVMR
jgi:hypothetical protein